MRKPTHALTTTAASAGLACRPRVWTSDGRFITSRASVWPRPGRCSLPWQGANAKRTPISKDTRNCQHHASLSQTASHQVVQHHSNVRTLDRSHHSNERTHTPTHACNIRPCLQLPCVRAGVALNANTLADQAQDARQLCSVTSRTVSVSQTPKAQISVPSHRSWMRSAAARATYSVVHPARKSTAAPSESWLVASDVDGLSDGQYEVCCTSTAACTTEFASNTASLASYFALPPQAQECPHTCIPDGRAKV